MKSKRLIIIVLVVSILLLIPFIAMQFTTEVNWTSIDFGVAGVLLLGIGLFCELVLRKVANRKLRIALCAILLTFLFLLWAELAVGIFDTSLGGH
jgi:peptidoglycan/LPS O-acetylase OafA/YrhL